MGEPREMPVGRLIITFPDGSLWEREWTMKTIGESPSFIAPGGGAQPIPDYLQNASKRWDHPWDPIIFRAEVKPGREAEARDALGAT